MENLRIIVAGHIGNGINTLIGRLLYETGSLPNDMSGKISKSKAITNKEGFVPTIEQLTKTENDEVDVPQIEFETAHRNYTFIIPADHKEFLKNIVTGAIEADAAILVIDASKGLLNQIYQYAYLFSMLRIKEIIIVVNKMDLKLYNRIKFWELSEEIGDFLKRINMYIIAIVPASARYGDNITTKSSRMDWNTSATLMKSLDYLSTPKNLIQLPLRLIVQSSYLTDSKTKILAKVASGKIFEGHQLTFGPTHHAAKVISIEVSANSGESVAVVLENTNYLERGQVGFNVCHPPLTTDFVIAEVFWVGAKSLKPDDKIDVLCGTRHCPGRIEKISEILDPPCLDVNLNYVNQLAECQVATVKINLDSPICIDPFDELPELGRFAIFQDSKIAGGGIFK